MEFFEGTVEEYTIVESIIEVTFDVGLMLKVFIDKRSFLEFNLSKGIRVRVEFRLFWSQLGVCVECCKFDDRVNVFNVKDDLVSMVQ
jgi:hypothetical protein